MRRNIVLITLMVGVLGLMNSVVNAADDPVQAIRDSKTPVHMHSLASGDIQITNWGDVNGSQWHSLYPPTTYCHNWACIGGIDNGNGLLSAGDRLKLQHIATGKSLWTLVEWVTTTVVFRDTLSNDTMYVEYVCGYDTCPPPLGYPFSVLWHEILPEYCNSHEITGFSDNGDGILSTCDYAQFDGDPEWWHVEDVATDILVQSIPDPTVPTLTQWGVIVLVALLISSAIFIMLRRRKATTLAV